MVIHSRLIFFVASALNKHNNRIRKRRYSSDKLSIYVRTMILRQKKSIVLCKKHLNVGFFGDTTILRTIYLDNLLDSEIYLLEISIKTMVVLIIVCCMYFTFVLDYFWIILICTILLIH